MLTTESTYFYWKELLYASHFIAAGTQHFPAAVKMPRTSFLTQVQSELGRVLLVNKTHPLCLHRPLGGLRVPEFHHNISKLISSFTPFPSTVTFNAALSSGNGDVLWSPILYVASGRGSLLPFFTLYLLPLNRGSSVEIIRILIPS